MARIKLNDLGQNTKLDAEALKSVSGGGDFGYEDVSLSGAKKGADNKSGGTSINYGNMTGGAGGGTFGSFAGGSSGSAGGGNASASSGGGGWWWFGGGGGHSTGGTADGGHVAGGQVMGGVGGANSIVSGGSSDNLSDNVSIPVTMSI